VTKDGLGRYYKGGVKIDMVNEFEQEELVRRMELRNIKQAS